MTEEGVSEFEYRSIEIIHLNKREKNIEEKINRNMLDSKKGLTFVLSRVSELKGKGSLMKKLFKERLKGGRGSSHL